MSQTEQPSPRPKWYTPTNVASARFAAVGFGFFIALSAVGFGVFAAVFYGLGVPGIRFALAGLLGLSSVVGIVIALDRRKTGA